MVNPTESAPPAPSCDHTELTRGLDQVTAMARANRWLLGLLVAMAAGGIGLSAYHANIPYHLGVTHYVNGELQRLEGKIERRDQQVNDVLFQLSSLAAEVRGMVRSLDRINDKLDEYDQNIRRFYRENPNIKDPNLPR